MSPFLGKPSIIHNPLLNGHLRLHRRRSVATHLLQHGFIAPRHIGYQVVLGLMHSAHLVRSQSRRHRLHNLALAGQQQSVQ